MEIINQLDEAYALLRQGKIIAYPTEAMYGLGCDPFNQQAVTRLLALKQRTIAKGLIILIANWSQLDPLIYPLSKSLLIPVQKTWPGHVTWIFPKSSCIPSWVSGGRETIAIRMSAHPIAQALCLHGPIVSSSANLSGQPPALSLEALNAQFPTGIDGFLQGALGEATQPSFIYDVVSGERLR